MANFDVLAEQGRAIFLQHSQKELIARYHLAADEDRIRLRFCGEDFEISRESGTVTGMDGRLAGPAEMLTIYDMLCGNGAAWGLSGEWCTTGMLPGSGQSSPNDVALHKPMIALIEKNPQSLTTAFDALGGRPFPIGDLGWEFPVFDWFPAVFQFWQGDEEFPSSVRFLWDRNALHYLRFETLFYVMGHVLHKLAQRME